MSPSPWPSGRKLKNVAQVACTRAIVPLRMKILNDAARAQGAIEMFDQMAADRGLNIVERSVTSDWLTATVNAEASIAPIITANLWKKDDGTHEEGGTDEEGNDGSPSGTDEASSSGRPFDVNVSITCNGLPPYPKKGDVILSSNFHPAGWRRTAHEERNLGRYKPQEFAGRAARAPASRSRIGRIRNVTERSRPIPRAGTSWNSTAITDPPAIPATVPCIAPSNCTGASTASRSGISDGRKMRKRTSCASISKDRGLQGRRN
jgi:hypothetical protein